MTNRIHPSEEFAVPLSCWQLPQEAFFLEAYHLFPQTPASDGEKPVPDDLSPGDLLAW